MALGDWRHLLLARRGSEFKLLGLVTIFAADPESASRKLCHMSGLLTLCGWQCQLVTERARAIQINGVQLMMLKQDR